MFVSSCLSTIGENGGYGSGVGNDNFSVSTSTCSALVATGSHGASGVLSATKLPVASSSAISCPSLNTCIRKIHILLVI